jgi:lactoylglutathione lyase
MSQQVFFRAVGPIGDTDTSALPVKEIGPAIGYYTQCLGFSLVSKNRTTAKLKRDDVQIGLAVNGRDPEQASCWFSVSNVDALWHEFDANGIEPGIIDDQEYDGKPYRVCFCFTQPA